VKDTYLTVSKYSEGLYKEKGSKFLAFAYPTDNEDQVKNFLDELKKKYYDARHHCYAFIIGIDGEYYRSNDDGEPNHSAGDPILGQIRSRELTNTLVVVVRYFGGTKLGVSGLINAYKTAAADAIDNSQIVEKLITKPIHIQFQYPELNDVMRIIKEYDLEISHQVMDLRCKMTLNVRLKILDEVYEKISLLHGVKQSD